MSQHSSPSALNSQWRSAQSGVVDLLKHILASGEMSDVLFTVGRQYGEVKTFPAHKFVLSLNSDVFHTMFNGALPESGDGAIDIPEILPDAFTNMLKYMYTRCLDNELQVDNVFETIYCADKYNLPKLLELCLHFATTQLNADNCLIFAEKIKLCTHDGMAAFLEKCLNLLDKHCDILMQSEQFSAIGHDTLEMILQRNTLSAGENRMYTAVEKCCRWATDNCLRENLEPSQANRRRLLGNALFLVRMPLLTDAELANGPVKSRLLLDSELLDIYQFKHSDSKPQLPFPTEPRQGRSLIPSGYSAGLRDKSSRDSSSRDISSATVRLKDLWS
ncbi:BTB/POZ domain-containing protein 6-B-like [Paramacrobiotus metropolitanus]|uniref:BTB/POZ domain-containing protein 6-B-like n=1 Tax=Paramacrobiotus metropolitanus TaxID=2943436 RepID=UPI0024465625|nr:BTB/POZ domain-containing protein 6-B-like [Paramacrobiotus metropolitanus]